MLSWFLFHNHIYLESGDHSFLWIDFTIQSCKVRDDIESLALTRIEQSKVLNLHPEKDNLLKQLVARPNGMILWDRIDDQGARSRAL